MLVELVRILGYAPCQNERDKVAATVIASRRSKTNQLKALSQNHNATAFAHIYRTPLGGTASKTNMLCIMRWLHANANSKEDHTHKA
mgnify:CR=1 FL=1